MTTVVSDTSPINYLCQIGEIGLLPQLFSRILIPPQVITELRHANAPQAVAAWVSALPPWVTVQAPHSILPDLGLDPGETEAISLAVELGLKAVLIDERAGRLAVECRGLAAIGTLAILDAADLHGLTDLEKAVQRLKGTNFRINRATLDGLVARARSRRRE